MRYLFVIIISILLSLSAYAQRIVHNEKAPKIEVDSYIIGSAPTKGKVLYIDFFVYGAQQNLEELSTLNTMAEKHRDKIDFVVVTKDNSDEIIEFFNSLGELFFSVAYDSEGKTFANFDIKYIPFSAIIDKKGHFVWQGRSSKLTDEIVQSYTQ